MAGPTIGEQTRQAVSNCQRVLAAGGGSIEDVVDVGVLLTNPQDFAGMNAVYAEAARKATNLAERDHLTRQAARLNTRLRS